MGNGIANDDSVTTANISGVTFLDISYNSISDLTGIESFVMLKNLYCEENLLTFLDFSQNLALEKLDCHNNQLTSVNVSLNLALTNYLPWGNLLTSIDVSPNIALTTLICSYNQLTSLNLSQNTALIYLVCNFSQLSCLNIKNGNNINSIGLIANDNPNLTCIEVDDAIWASANFTQIDPVSTFSENCSNTCTEIVGLNEISTTSRKLLKIVDLMGRTTDFIPNTPLIFIYSDGTVERIFKME